VVEAVKINALPSGEADWELIVKLTPVATEILRFIKSKRTGNFASKADIKALLDAKGPAYGFSPQAINGYKGRIDEAHIDF
jgi:hypothetical protein